MCRIETATEDLTQIDRLKREILKSIKGCKLETEVKGKYFCFLLPKKETGKFPSLLRMLRAYTEGYPGRHTAVLSRFTIRSTSLDEVFLKLGKEAEGEAQSIELKNLAKNIVKERLSRKAHDEERNRANIERQKVRKEILKDSASTEMPVIEEKASYNRWTIFTKLAWVSTVP